MKNILVANFRPVKGNSSKQYPLDKLKLELSAQIENSLNMGWNQKDIWVVSNFSFAYMGVGAFFLPLNSDCLTGSKSFAMRELFWHDMIQEDVWVHDLDAWQCVPFEFPQFKDVGIAQYSRPKYNGGSVFYSPGAKDIVEGICSMMEMKKEKREEPTIDHAFKNIYKDRVTCINHTWNLGCSGYAKRWFASEMPLKVVHFHPLNRMAWDTHTRNRNNIADDAVISTELKDLFLKYFGKTIRTYTYEDKADPLVVRKDWKGTRYEKVDYSKFMPQDEEVDFESIELVEVDGVELTPEPGEVTVTFQYDELKDIPPSVPTGQIFQLVVPETKKLENTELLSQLRSIRADKLADKEFLARFINDSVGLSLNTRKLRIDDTKVTDCWGGLRCKQYPQELAGLLAFMYEHKDKINSYFEIGVERGGTFFTVDSYLRCVCAGYSTAVGIDLSDKIVRKHNYAAYHAIHPGCTFQCVSSREFVLPYQFSFCLIDGDHSYEGVKADYEAVIDKCMYVAFHDIRLKGSGVEKFWNEIKDTHSHHVEFVNEDLERFPEPIGIGVVW